MRLYEYDYLEETHLIMGSSSQYCLRWNNHQTNLLSAFDALLRQQAFTDVTLACEEGVTLHAHRLVLAACSSYFSSLFSSTSPTQHPIVVLKDVRASEMRALLHYMYRGEVNVEQSQLKTLLRVAQGLQVKGLVEDLVSSTQTYPLPLTTTNSQPPQSNITPFQRYTPRVTPSPTPAESRITPTCADGWEPESLYPSARRLYLPSPPSPYRRPRSEIKDEPINLRDQSPQGHPYFHPYLSQTNHSPFVPYHPPFDMKDHIKPLRDPYEREKLEMPSRPSSPEPRDMKSSPIHHSEHTAPSSISEPRSPSPKRPKKLPGEGLVSPTPILRTALAHTQQFRPDMTKFVSLASSMMPLPPLISAQTQSLATNEELKRASDNHSTENNFIPKSQKKLDILSDEDSKSFIDISREEESQEKINGPMYSEFPNYHIDPANPSHFSNFVSYVPTPKPEWKRYKQYTKADLMHAIDAVRTGMTALQASRKFKVPSRTLYDKIKKMGINTIPRRLPSKKPNSTDIETSDQALLQLRQHLPGALDGRSSRGEYYSDRPLSRESNEPLPLTGHRNQSSLPSGDEKVEKMDIVSEAKESHSEEQVVETSARGSFSLVGTKVYSEDESGPLDLTETDSSVPSRNELQERT